jgi:REP element-mobilizing transposase RayT
MITNEKGRLEMRSYDPDIHHRRSIRLQEYDYAQNGAYFVTICLKDGVCLFGNVIDGTMKPNEYGEIARTEWERLGSRFQTATFDVFQIMPNHVHGVICIVGATLAVAQSRPTTKQRAGEQRAGASPAPTVGDIVGAYKSLVYKRYLDLRKSQNVTVGRLWHRNYYEHIIRNEDEYVQIAEYIRQNPMNWKLDRLYKEDTGNDYA